MSHIFNSPLPETVEEKTTFLLKNKIALCDVLAACEITGSSDNSIKNAVANDISQIIYNSKIENIFINGKTAEKYYNKYIKAEINQDAVCLPSTSPANAAWTFEKLCDAWRIIKSTF